MNGLLPAGRFFVQSSAEPGRTAFAALAKMLRTAPKCGNVIEKILKSK